MSESEMQAELERLRAENAQLKSKDKGGLSLKVSEKGGVSLYGMGRFPVTLYKEQWRNVMHGKRADHYSSSGNDRVGTQRCTANAAHCLRPALPKDQKTSPQLQEHAYVWG
jgi:hypothetical protein